MTDFKLKSMAVLLTGVGVLLIGIAMLFLVFNQRPISRQTAFAKVGSETDSSCTAMLTNSLTEAQIDAMSEFLKNNIGPLDTAGMAEQIIDILSKDPKLRSLGCDSDGMREYIRNAFNNPEVSKQFLERVLTEDQLKAVIQKMTVKVTKRTVVTEPKP